jgi:hypothetical protein
MRRKLLSIVPFLVLLNETCQGRLSQLPVWLLCQDRFGAYGEKGDSGSPVFATTPAGVYLYGIAWGGSDADQTVFSSMSNMGLDNLGGGDLRTN